MVFEGELAVKLHAKDVEVGKGGNNSRSVCWLANNCQ